MRLCSVLVEGAPTLDLTAEGGCSSPAVSFSVGGIHRIGEGHEGKARLVFAVLDESAFLLPDSLFTQRCNAFRSLTGNFLRISTNVFRFAYALLSDNPATDCTIAICGVVKNHPNTPELA